MECLQNFDGESSRKTATCNSKKCNTLRSVKICVSEVRFEDGRWMYPVVGFGISCVEPWGFVTREITSQPSHGPAYQTCHIG
jgi:predicted ATPase